MAKESAFTCNDSFTHEQWLSGDASIGYVSFTTFSKQHPFVCIEQRHLQIFFFIYFKPCFNFWTFAVTFFWCFFAVWFYIFSSCSIMMHNQLMKIDVKNRNTYTLNVWGWIKPTVTNGNQQFSFHWILRLSVCFSLLPPEGNTNLKFLPERNHNRGKRLSVCFHTSGYSNGLFFEGKH